MPDPSDQELFEAVQDGDDAAFERVYDRYQQRARLVAWRITHRPDWVDELLSEAWCRAFRMRTSYNSSRPFLSWFGGILQNVYREHCRRSPITIGTGNDRPDGTAGGVDTMDPEKIAAEAELLSGLNDCVDRLGPDDARLVRLRFFRGQTLRAVAKEVNVPESTLREHRLPAVFRKLRECLAKKGIDFSQLSPAQLSDVLQYSGEDSE